MISLLLVEDHTTLAEILVRFLSTQNDLRVAARAASAERALALLPTLSVDLAIIDVSLPGMSGIELVDVLQTQAPDLPCLVLSGHTQADYVKRALQAGARGYVSKAEPYALLDAIQAILGGAVYVSKELE